MKGVTDHLRDTEGVHEVVEGNLVVAVVHTTQEATEHLQLNAKLRQQPKILVPAEDNI